MTRPNSPNDEIQRDYDVALDEMYGVAPEIIDLFKVRISFWDKLVILNAGTLALSFTVAATFRGHAVGDGGVGYLFAAWKLLLISIVSAVFAQWTATGAATFFFKASVALRANRKFVRVSEKIATAGLQCNGTHLELIGKTQIDAHRSGESYRRLEFVAHACGALSQAASTVAFYWLYRFTHVNLAHL
jgi:hypothetical protein